MYMHICIYVYIAPEPRAQNPGGRGRLGAEPAPGAAAAQAWACEERAARLGLVTRSVYSSNDGLLCLNGRLWGIVSLHVGLLGFPG